MITLIETATVTKKEGEYTLTIDEERGTIVCKSDSEEFEIVVHPESRVSTRQFTDIDINRFREQVEQYLYTGQTVTQTYEATELQDEYKNEKNNFVAQFNPEKTQTVEKERTVITSISNCYIDTDSNEIDITFEMTGNESVQLTIQFSLINKDKEVEYNSKDTYTCPYCDTEIEIECSSSGYQEEAYCNSCRILFFRGRDVVTDTITRDMLYCEECEKTHPVTSPRENTWSEKEFSLWGREDYGVTCKCGNTIRGSNITVNEPVNCECGRTVELSITE